MPAYKHKAGIIKLVETLLFLFYRALAFVQM